MILDLVLMPLGLGAACYLLGRAHGLGWARGAIIALGVVAVFVSLWGLPPLPAISSKHKIIYLLLAVAAVAPLVARVALPARILTAVALGLAAFLWLNWRRFVVGLPVEVILLSMMALVAVAFGLWRSESEREQPFLWPAGLVVATLGLGVVSLLSGYLGLGQTASGVAAFFGGVLLLPYAAGRVFDVPHALVWVGFSVVSVLAIGLASFATNLHPLAFLCVIVALLSPLSGRWLPTVRSDLLRPIVFAATALPFAGAGVATAFLHF